MLSLLASHVFGSSPGNNAGAASSTRRKFSDEAVPEYAASDINTDPIAERIRDGDAAAFSELVGLHYNGMLRFAASLLPDKESADDVVQDILFRVWEGRSSIDPRRSLRTYLFTSLRNRVLDMQKHDRVVARFAEAGRYEFPDSGSSPDKEFDAQLAAEYSEAQLTALAEALKTLPERSRSALVLRYEQGMTYPEIGSVLQCSDKAAQQVIRRAILSLRSMLDDGV